MRIPNGRRSLTFIGKLLAASLVSSVMAQPAFADVVRAEDHRAFWLWAGVKPQPVLADADEIYILAGEVSGEETPIVKAQRSATPQVRSSKVWIVFRAQMIAWDAATLAAVISRVEAWDVAGNDITGLQIDFDAGTKNLNRYAAFLKQVRRALPKQYRLSVTGLLDWSANGDPTGLDAIADVVDEVVLQIYQGRQVIPGYHSYLAKLDRIKMPFRIGLLQGGDWSAPAALEGHPMFRGYVVFLLNQSAD
jgi:hypothetical protein